MTIGSLMDCLAESVGIGWVQSKSVGICQKKGGSVKYTFTGTGMGLVWFQGYKGCLTGHCWFGSIGAWFKMLAFISRFWGWFWNVGISFKTSWLGLRCWRLVWDITIGFEMLVLVLRCCFQNVGTGVKTLLLVLKPDIPHRSPTMGLPSHFPPTHMPSWNPSMLCRVAYIPHWRGEARWQYFGWLKRGKEFLTSIIRGFKTYCLP